MKYIFSILSLLFCICLSAQETTTQIARTSATTFVQTNVTTYADGRIVTEQIPYSLAEFAGLAIDQNINNLISIDQRTDANTKAQRDVNQLKIYVRDSLAMNYDSLLSTKLLTALEGGWKFIERPAGGSNIVTPVDISRNTVNPAFLKMKITGAPGAWNLKAIHTQRFEVRNYQVGGVGETVEMSLTQFANFTGYRGKASDGTILILRR